MGSSSWVRGPAQPREVADSEASCHRHSRIVVAVFFVALIGALTATLLGIGVVVVLLLRARTGQAKLAMSGLLAVVLIATSPVTVAWAMWFGAAASCRGLPIDADSFAADYVYHLPGDPGYGPSLWPITPDAYYCTEGGARSHGYNRGLH